MRKLRASSEYSGVGFDRISSGISTRSSRGARAAAGAGRASKSVACTVFGGSFFAAGAAAAPNPASATRRGCCDARDAAAVPNPASATMFARSEPGFGVAEGR